MVALRRPDQVMRLARMGSFHPTCLSFMPTLLRRLQREHWRYRRTAWDIDERGVGHAVYTVAGAERAYSLVCFAHDLPDEMRSDRVIATAWDATFTLFDGIPDEADVERLGSNVPRQEAGRISDSELTMARANRSVRLFEHVVSSLASGEQPDPVQIDSVGYLMRTTAVYGSGKFGAADREKIRHRDELSGPFQAEMLTVWLIRTFVSDLINHLARARGGDRATTLGPALRQRLGIGNSTGLGMAPFLINHPVLINNWMAARESALARVRDLPAATSETICAFGRALNAARENARVWQSDHPIQQAKLDALRADLEQIAERVADADNLSGPEPWNALWCWSESTLSLEGQEALVALILEPHTDIVDDLTTVMDADEDAVFRIDGAMTVGALTQHIALDYEWALGENYGSDKGQARFWYVSEEKLEPRLGERFDEPGAEREQPLATGRDVAALAESLMAWHEDDRVADFLMRHPEHRHAVRRVQIAMRYPYAEIRDNLISADLMPIDLLRCKLSFFGATRFDPRSDRWVRIAMFPDAPYPDDILAPLP